MRELAYALNNYYKMDNFVYTMSFEVRFSFTAHNSGTIDVYKFLQSLRNA